MWSETALLTPVPHQHLESGLEVFLREARVAYGSDSAEVMAETAILAELARVRVLFYASHAPDAFPSRVTWTAEFSRLESPKGKRHPHHERLRPKSTDSDGDWLIFYEVTNLRRLGVDEQLLLSSLKKRDGKKVSKGFIPQGPVLIENPI